MQGESPAVVKPFLAHVFDPGAEMTCQNVLYNLLHAGCAARVFCILP